MKNKLPLDGSICGSSTWFGTNNWVSVGDLTSFKRFKVPWVAIFFVSNSFNSRPGCLGLSSPRERPRVKAWGPWWAYKVEILWEGHKMWKKNLPSVLTKKLFLLSSFKTSGRFLQIFVAFSEKLNFIKKWRNISLYIKSIKRRIIF